VRQNDITAYPLSWPDGWPRSKTRTENSPFQVTSGQAIEDLYGELERLGAKSIVLSSNLTINTFHKPYAKQPKQDDPGIAVYFILNDVQMVMARDKYSDWRDNIRSLGLAIVALRGLHRHGGAHMMERAFNGFAALPNPESIDWRVIFGVHETFTKTAALAVVEKRYRQLSSRHHPDHGGDEAEFDRITKARDAARKELQ